MLDSVIQTLLNIHMENNLYNTPNPVHPITRLELLWSSWIMSKSIKLKDLNKKWTKTILLAYQKRMTRLMHNHHSRGEGWMDVYNNLIRSYLQWHAMSTLNIQ